MIDKIWSLLLLCFFLYAVAVCGVEDGECKTIKIQLEPLV